MANIIIEVSGGIVAVYSDENIKYTIVDHDLENGGDLTEFEPDGFFKEDEKEALINYLINYGGDSQDSY